MRLLPALLRNPSLRPQKLPRASLPRLLPPRTINNAHAPTLKRASSLLTPSLFLTGPHHFSRRTCLMTHPPLATRALPRKAQRRGEDGLSTLSRLYCPCGEGTPRAHVFYVVEDRYGTVSCQHEVRVHAMDYEGGRDGALGCTEALRYYGAAVDAPGARGVPEGARVGVYFLVESVSFVLEAKEGKRRTGPITAREVSSRTFSMGALVGSRGGGRTRVARLVSSVLEGSAMVMSVEWRRGVSIDFDLLRLGRRNLFGWIYKEDEEGEQQEEVCRPCCLVYTGWWTPRYIQADDVVWTDR